MKILSIDPGANVGMVWIDIPALNSPLSEICGFASQTIVRPGASKKRADELARDMALYEMVSLALPSDCDIALLEESDISSAWRGRSTRTDYRHGTLTGLVLGALYGNAKEIVRIPVRGSRKAIGWIRGRKPLIVQLETKVLLHNAMKDWEMKVKWNDMSEHEQSALGMLFWYLRQHKDM